MESIGNVPLPNMQIHNLTIQVGHPTVSCLFVFRLIIQLSRETKKIRKYESVEAIFLYFIRLIAISTQEEWWWLYISLAVLNE